MEVESTIAKVVIEGIQTTFDIVNVTTKIIPNFHRNYVTCHQIQPYC